MQRLMSARKKLLRSSVLCSNTKPLRMNETRSCLSAGHTERVHIRPRLCAQDLPKVTWEHEPLAKHACHAGMLSLRRQGGGLLHCQLTAANADGDVW